MFFLAGGMSILLGIQSEVIMRTYYETQHKTTYLVGEIRQGNTDGEGRLPRFASNDDQKSHSMLVMYIDYSNHILYPA